MSTTPEDRVGGATVPKAPPTPEQPKKRAGATCWLVGVSWYLLALWAVLVVLARVVVPSWDKAGGGLVGLVVKTQGVLGLILLAIAFVLVHLGWRAAWRWSGGAGGAGGEVGKQGTLKATEGRAFPTPPTLQIGVGVASFAALSLAAVVAMIRFGVGSDVRQAVLMTCAAGVGSSVATILGFLEHASEKGDFKAAYTPWYVGRPAMGLLLGLLFFLLLRGGMLGVLPNLDASKLNPYGLAAIGGLVGLFTKHAVEKLQEVFDVLFQTKSQAETAATTKVIQELKAKLPDQLKAQLEPYLPKPAAPAGGEQAKPADASAAGGAGTEKPEQKP